MVRLPFHGQATQGGAPGSTYCLREDGLFDLPLHQPRVDPEGVDAKRDDAQERPFDPQPEDAPPGADELKLSAVEVGVLRPPTLNEDQGERVADPDGADRYQDAEDLGAEPGSSPATELVDLYSRDGPGAGGHHSSGVCDGHLPVRRNVLFVDAQGIPQ
jgi:hypothetical protein